MIHDDAWFAKTPEHLEAMISLLRAGGAAHDGQLVPPRRCDQRRATQRLGVLCRTKLARRRARVRPPCWPTDPISQWSGSRDPRLSTGHRRRRYGWVRRGHRRKGGSLGPLLHIPFVRLSVPRLSGPRDEGRADDGHDGSHWSQWTSSSGSPASSASTQSTSSDAVDLDLVELVPLEDPVVVAGCGVAVQDHSGVLDRRLVGVDHGEEFGRVETQ